MAARDDDDDDNELQFQMPNFVLGGAPSLAHAGGAEVLPGMYGQGTHVWSECAKYWYDQSHQLAPSKHPVHTDHGPPRVCITPRPFEFDPPSPSPPHMDSSRCALQGQRVSNFAPVPPPPHVTYSFPSPNFVDPTAPLPPLPPNGLPLYSASGFDMLRMLAKVATRPNPKIMLGPVDMTCSFVVVDVRRPDSPIVYASPTFTRLTGYSEAEVLGRNCRFLQHPSGQIQRGDPRQFTAPDAVRHLHKSLLQDKECQASLINYRKDGGAFINLVTVIPISSPEDERDGDSGEITHCVGFQVDLAEQPNAILQKLRDGSYIVNYSSAGMGAPGFTGGPGYGLSLATGMGRERRGKGVSAEMIELLRSARAYLGTRPGGQIGDVGIKGARDNDRLDLHSLLLENTDDFIHVVSLKGSLLYVAPAVTRVLGHNPADLVGKSIADLCHPADVVPLMRELKDASSAPAQAMSSQHHGHGHGHGQAALPGHAPLFMLPTPHHTSAPPPKPVHLLFRAQYKSACGGGTGYVWLEARGRLHVEQGKGRKAIVLVGRRVDVPRLTWGALERAQRVFSGVHEDGGDGVMATTMGGDVAKEVDECWGLVAPNGIVLSAGPMGAQRLGLAAPPPPSGPGATSAGGPSLHYHLMAPGDPATLVGRSLASLVVPEQARRVGEVLADAACLGRDEVRRARCRMRVWGRGHALVHGQVPGQGQEGMAEFQGGSEGESIPVEMRFFAQERERKHGWEGESGCVAGGEGRRAPSLPPSLVFQMLFLDEVVDDVGGGANRLLHSRPHSHSPPSYRPVYHTSSPDTVSPPSSSSSSYTLRSVLHGSPIPMEQSMVSPTSTTTIAGVGVTAFPRPRIPMHNVRARTPHPAHANILAELSTAVPSAVVSPSSTTAASLSGDTSALASSSIASASVSASVSASASISVAEASETSWQYELTRLRFENERMREEVRRLERARKGLGMTRMRARTIGGAGAGMRREGVVESVIPSMSPSSSLSVDASHVHPHMMGMGMGMGVGMAFPLSPMGVPQKRTREGELKRPLT